MTKNRPVTRADLIDLARSIDKNLRIISSELNRNRLFMVLIFVNLVCLWWVK